MLQIFFTYVPKVFLFFALNTFITPVSTFTIPTQHIRSRSIVLTATAFDSTTAKDLKTEIENEIQSTKRGLQASPEKVAKIDSLVKSLEAICPYSEPARMPIMGGKWIVDYTTAPPPSNGKLGPFVGIARQIIDLDVGTYTNYLSVPGDIEKEWLSARLEATFVEWDGEILDDGERKENSVSSDDPDEVIETEETPSNWFQSIGSVFQQKKTEQPSLDYGADSWKVDFKTLTIKVFGFQLIQQSFAEGTSRVWKMSYLDDEGTRIGKHIGSLELVTL